MGIQVECEHCKASYKVKSEFAGKRAKCPKCKQVVQVPFLGKIADKAEKASKVERTVKAEKAEEAVLKAERVSEISEAEVAAALSGRLEGIALPVIYRLAAVVVSVVMVVLPMIYVSLIALVCYATYYHAVNHFGVFSLSHHGRGRGTIFAVLLYLGPLAMGAIMVLFMIKPLFARSADDSRRRSVTPKSDPVLFSFVARLCEVVGAPMPKRIDVDCDVNASASFRRGVLSMFSGNDLILTIGLPLIVGMDLRQFAGVLAHEFGHFSQGTGMRLTYFIRGISFWFVRVVYERDEWDQRLDEGASQAHFWISIVLHAVRLCVWLSRWILWVLMFFGHAVSGLLLRQMEYDADRQEARLAGSDVFEATSRRLAILGVAMNGAQSDLGYFYQEGRLADNMPRLMMINVGEMPKEVLQKIDEHLAESTTGIFDTHPCHNDRVENACRENAPGIFNLELPATVLFSDFDGLSRAVTWDYYRSVFGPSFQPSKMHSLDDLIDRKKREQEAVEAYERFFMGPFPIIRPLELPGILLGEPDEPKRVAVRLRAARDKMKVTRPAYDKILSEYDKADDRVIEAAAGRAILQAKLRIPKDVTEMKIATVADAENFSRRTLVWMNQTSPQMMPFERAVGQRLFDGLLLLQVPKVAARLENGKQWQADSDRLVPILREIEKQRPRILQLRLKCVALGSLTSQLESNGDNERLVDTVVKHMKVTHQAVSEIRKSFGGLRYPFDHVDKTMTVGKCAVEVMPHEQDLVGILEASNSILSLTGQLRHRMIAHLAFIAEHVESTLGLKPLPMPEKKGESPDIV